MSNTKISALSQGHIHYSVTGADQSLQNLVRALSPKKPLYIVNRDILKRTAARFVAAFPGTALYAVKTNPDKEVIKSLIDGGVTSFDVASLEEIKLVHSVKPDAQMHFMHPIKAPEDIRAAYFDYGIRHFVLDHEEELYKIMRETDLAQDLNLTVRLALPKNEKAQIDFSSKFGASFTETLDLLEKCKPVSGKLGLSFHVGTQTTDTTPYIKAVQYCAALMRESGVTVDTLNIGGGYPVRYDEAVSAIEEIVKDVQDTLKAEGFEGIKLYAEPGRVLVAEAGKLVARVELRKGSRLYMNDGVYGGLFDASDWLKLQYPVAAVSCDREFDGGAAEYTLLGPTCDSLDTLSGAYVLPSDIGVGDWIVFDNVGAYSGCLRSNFNGFGHADVVYI